MNMISICLMNFLFLIVFSVAFMFLGLDFLLMDYSIFIEWEIFSLNSSSIMMSILLDWMSLMFMSSGVYLLIRFNLILNDNKNFFLLLIGSVTMLMAS